MLRTNVLLPLAIALALFAAIVIWQHRSPKPTAKAASTLTPRTISATQTRPTQTTVKRTTTAITTAKPEQLAKPEQPKPEAVQAKPTQPQQNDEKAATDEKKRMQAEVSRLQKKLDREKIQNKSDNEDEIRYLRELIEARRQNRYK